MTPSSEITANSYYNILNNNINTTLEVGHAFGLQAQVVEALEWAIERISTTVNPFEGHRGEHAELYESIQAFKYQFENFQGSVSNKNEATQIIRQALRQKQEAVNKLAGEAFRAFTPTPDPFREKRKQPEVGASSNSSRFSNDATPKKLKLETYPSQLKPLVEERLLTIEFASTLTKEADLTTNLLLMPQSLTLMRKKVIAPQQVIQLKIDQIEELALYVEMKLIASLIEEEHFKRYLSLLKSPEAKDLFDQGELSLEQSQYLSEGNAWRLKKLIDLSRISNALARDLNSEQFQKFSSFLEDDSVYQLLSQALFPVEILLLFSKQAVVNLRNIREKYQWNHPFIQRLGSANLKSFLEVLEACDFLNSTIDLSSISVIQTIMHADAKVLLTAHILNPAQILTLEPKDKANFKALHEKAHALPQEMSDEQVEEVKELVANPFVFQLLTEGYFSLEQIKAIDLENRVRMHALVVKGVLPKEETRQLDPSQLKGLQHSAIAALLEGRQITLAAFRAAPQANIEMFFTLLTQQKLVTSHLTRLEPGLGNRFFQKEILFLLTEGYIGYQRSIRWQCEELKRLHELIQAEVLTKDECQRIDQDVRPLVCLESMYALFLNKKIACAEFWKLGVNQRLNVEANLLSSARVDAFEKNQIKWEDLIQSAEDNER